MKMRQSDSYPEHRQPAATPSERAPLQAVHAVEASQSQLTPREAAQRRMLEASFGPALQRQPVRSLPNQTGMPDSLRAGIESLSGMDMSDVRVHRDSNQPAQLNALAYAQGNDIHLGPGQEQHLPHEAWHVAQQRQGRVQATSQMAGVGVNDDAGLEAEADSMGAKAMQTKSDFVAPSELGSFQRKRLVGQSATKPIFQLQTRVYYAPPNNRAGATGINNIAHTRNLHNGTQRDLAAYHSGYVNSVNASQQGAFICNHFVSYAAIRDAVIDELSVNTATQDLDGAVGWLTNTYNANLAGGRPFHNGGFGFTFGAIPAAVIPNLGGGGAPQYDEQTVDNEIDDAIFNLANDPQNLFYWPNTTHADPDVPVGAGNQNMAGNNVNAANLLGRLTTYRNYLANTLNLNVP